MLQDNVEQDHHTYLNTRTKRHLALLVAISTLILFICSSARHWLFHSSADLAIFDQYAYLISRGLPPISSILGFHLLGDHAAYSFYWIGILYRIKAEVHWLFLIQAFALAVGAIPVALLAIQAGIPERKAITLSYVYLLYPLIFNVNLADFHPEVMALPCLFWAIWWARQSQLIPFLLCVVFILGCKAVLSLSIFAMGFWLLVWERRRAFGMAAMALGLAWFIVANQFVIPQLRATEIGWIDRYDFLGNSVLEIVWNLIKNPLIITQYLFTGANLGYLIYLLIPLVWGLAPQFLAPLIGAAPILFINLITDYPLQKDLLYQYSLPILPFLILVAIDSLSAKKSFIKNYRVIVIWSLIAFLALAKYGFFWSRYLNSADTLEATRTAISYVEPQGSVLAMEAMVPHLTHRTNIEILDEEIVETGRYKSFDFILINTRHPRALISTEKAETLVQRLQAEAKFQKTFEQDDVYVFSKSPT